MATEATPYQPFEDTTCFAGPVSTDRVGYLIDGLEHGCPDSVVFIVPDGPVWLLPIYEPALLIGLTRPACG